MGRMPSDVLQHELSMAWQHVFTWASWAIVAVMLAISVREAIRDAAAACGHGPTPVTFASPATPERVFFAVAQASCNAAHCSAGDLVPSKTSWNPLNITWLKFCGASTSRL